MTQVPRGPQALTGTTLSFPRLLRIGRTFRACFLKSPKKAACLSYTIQKIQLCLLLEVENLPILNNGLITREQNATTQSEKIMIMTKIKVITINEDT